ncbi:hypothetical protein HPB48_008887 [Haemaphysalis longicornis]|uniref:Uncharacterized protein n=1 Tax=Haemaphysalis longicornis TaxID=44386 RepID=A0A9J6H092_HAELO|nr:hypothetical protein HPB48_008887 [Haemaphysalis longicornis]
MQLQQPRWQLSPALQFSGTCATVDFPPPRGAQEWELRVLQRLDWDVASVVASDFVDHLVAMLRLPECADTVRRHAHTFVSLCATAPEEEEAGWRVSDAAASPSCGPRGSPRPASARGPPESRLYPAAVFSPPMAIGHGVNPQGPLCPVALRDASGAHAATGRITRLP